MCLLCVMTIHVVGCPKQAQVRWPMMWRGGQYAWFVCLINKCCGVVDERGGWLKTSLFDWATRVTSFSLNAAGTPPVEETRLCWTAKDCFFPNVHRRIWREQKNGWKITIKDLQPFFWTSPSIEVLHVDTCACSLVCQSIMLWGKVHWSFLTICCQNYIISSKVL